MQDISTFILQILETIPNVFAKIFNAQDPSDFCQADNSAPYVICFTLGWTIQYLMLYVTIDVL